MQKKYELIESEARFEGKRLWRLKALRDFGVVRIGAVGGLVEHDHNLSHEGTCWVSGNAMVVGRAEVLDGAYVRDNVIVSQRAQISGKARVSGQAKVCEFAKVTGNAAVSDRAVIGQRAWVGGWAMVGKQDYLFGDAVIRDIDDYLCMQIKYPILILQDVMHIGCQVHTHGAWQAMSWDTLNNMPGDAVEYWELWGPLLMRECYALKRRVSMNIKKGLYCE